MNLEGMRNRIEVAFVATQDQIEMIKEFCKDKFKHNYVVSVQQQLTEDTQLSISIFTNKPVIYIGIFSKEKKCIVPDAMISDNELSEALEMLELRYWHSLSKTPPSVNKELAYVWLKYFNTNSNATVVEL